MPEFKVQEIELDRALMDTGGWNPDTGYGVTFRAALDGTWNDSFQGEAKFKTDWKLLKLHGSTNWLVPHMGVDFHSLEYKSSVPDADDVFLYWHCALPYKTQLPTVIIHPTFQAGTSRKPNYRRLQATFL